MSRHVINRFPISTSVPQGTHLVACLSGDRMKLRKWSHLSKATCFMSPHSEIYSGVVWLLLPHYFLISTHHSVRIVKRGHLKLKRVYSYCLKCPDEVRVLEKFGGANETTHKLIWNSQTCLFGCVSAGGKGQVSDSPLSPCSLLSPSVCDFKKN